jgi:hypothetical protein
LIALIAPLLGAGIIFLGLVQMVASLSLHPSEPAAFGALIVVLMIAGAALALVVVCRIRWRSEDGLKPGKFEVQSKASLSAR